MRAIQSCHRGRKTDIAPFAQNEFLVGALAEDSRHHQERNLKHASCYCLGQLPRSRPFGGSGW